MGLILYTSLYLTALLQARCLAGVKHRLEAAAHTSLHDTAGDVLLRTDIVL